MPKTKKSKKANDDEEQVAASLADVVVEDDITQSANAADAAAIVYKEKLLFDMIDYELEYVLVDREGREKHWKFLLTLWEMYPDEKKQGRLNLRFQMCQILMDACGKPAYNLGSLVHWDGASWAELKQDVLDLKHMSTDFKRELDDHEQTAKLCERILCAIDINKTVAPIRKRLEEQIKENKKVGIRKSAIDQVFTVGLNHDHVLVKEYCRELFQKDDSDEFIPVLKDLDQLEEILGRKPFDLKWVQSKIETLTHGYNELCFPGQQPTLWKLGYNLPRVAKLTPARKSSTKKEKAATPKAPDPGLIAEADVGPFDKPKASASRLSFEDSEDEYEPARLGSIKRKRRRTSAPGVNPGEKSRYKGEAPDEGIFGEFGLVKERRPYSEEEVNAIIAGVVKHGVGKWVEIKNEYSHILRNRSSVQVKDKWRTLKRKRQLPEELLAAEDEKEAAKEKASTEEPSEELADHGGMVAEL